MRFTRLDHGHSAPGSARAAVGDPVAPGYALQMLDAGGNNVTHAMANSTVRLYLPPPEEAASLLRLMEREGGAAEGSAVEGLNAAGPYSRGPLNGGGVFGDLAVTALNGVARLDNVSFDEARSRKLVIATATLDGLSLGNATSGPLRVLPSAPAQMRFTLEPRSMYAPAVLPPTPVEAGAGMYQFTWKDSLGRMPPAAAIEAIDMDVAIFDRFGNHACNALMAEEECAYTDLGWEIALSLAHSDFVNYTYDERTAEWDLTTTLHAYRDTRTVSSPVVFEDGSLKATFRGLRIYRGASASPSTPPSSRSVLLAGSPSGRRDCRAPRACCRTLPPLRPTQCRAVCPSLSSSPASRRPSPWRRWRGAPTTTRKSRWRFTTSMATRAKTMAIALRWGSD